MANTMNQYKDICLIYNITIDGSNAKTRQKQRMDKYEISEDEIESRQNELAMIMHGRYAELY